MKIVMFSKHLQELSVREAGARARKLGFAGLDLTVRPGGHIAPEQVAQGLPAAVSALREEGCEIPMISTGITEADAAAEAICGVAAAQGIREIKLGYWPYRPFGDLLPQLDQARTRLEKLEALASRHNVRLSPHIHSGNYLTAQCALLAYLLRERDPHHIGAYIDPGHMFVEGGLGVWLQGLDLLQGRVSMIAVKSLVYAPEEREGEKTWRPVVVPLNEGMVRWREFWPVMKQMGWDGVVSFHSEYQGRGSWRDLKLQELLDQTRADLEYLRPIMRQAGYRP